MAAVKAILLHGNGGCTAADFWLPWLERELIALGLRVINETFPDNIQARARYWLPHLETLGADEHTILIGHSSGAVAAMRYAEQHRLLGSVLVAVCHSDLGDRCHWRCSDEHFRSEDDRCGRFLRASSCICWYSS